MDEKARVRITEGKSVFTGSMLGLLGIQLASGFLSAITLGIATPWLLCWKDSWYAEHTYINGKQLRFDGKGEQLFAKWIVWCLLTIVTFGIYGLWLPIKIKEWTVKHTRFMEAPRHESPVAPPEPARLPERKPSVGFCIGCGAALTSGNVMVDEKHCRKCKPAEEKHHGVPAYEYVAPDHRKAPSFGGKAELVPDPYAHPGHSGKAPDGYVVPNHTAAPSGKSSGFNALDDSDLS